MFTRSKLKGSLAGILVFLFLIMVFVQPAEAARKKGVIIGGCTPVGTWTLVAGMFSKLITKNYPGYAASPLGTSGCSIENVWRVHEKEMEIGLTTSNNIYAGYHGKTPFPKKMNILGAISIYSSHNHIIALKSSGIKTLEDLKGKRVAIFNPGTFAENFNRTILFPAAGIDVNKDFKKDNSSLPVGINKMKDGHVDAMSFAGGIGSSYFVDLASSRDIVFIPLTEEVTVKILKDNPFLSRLVIPAGSYKGQDKPILSVGPVNQLFVGNYQSEEFVYNITKIFFDHIDQMRKVHNIMKDINIESSFKNIPVPLHPGAAKFYAEHGLKK